MSGKQRTKAVTCILFLHLMTTCFCIRRSAAYASSTIITTSTTTRRTKSVRFLNEVCFLATEPPPWAPFFASFQPPRFSTSTAAPQQKDATVRKHESLTRTTVRRMKVQDLREQLELCGLVDIAKQKRTQLVALLLDYISKKRNDDETYRKSSNANDRQETCANADNSTNTHAESPVAIKNTTDDNAENNEVASGSNSTELDPSRTYILRPACVSGKGEDESKGSGIGLVLRDVNSDRVVWTAQKYLPASRSLYEATYTALVFALRCAVYRLRLPNLRVQIDESLVLNQMVGIYRVEKETLKPMQEEALRLKEVVGRNCSLELIPKLQNAESYDLARKAYQTETSTELFENDDDGEEDETIALLFSTDPMGKDYTGPSTQKVATDDKPIEITTSDGSIELETRDSEYSTTATMIDPSKKYILRFDGGARGNPGTAGAGMALFDDTGQEIWCGWKFLGQSMSNNQAEYYAVILGMQCALSLGIKRIECQGDSQLIVKQLNGQYKVKNEGLRKLWEASQTIIREFDSCEMKHVLRADNKRADALANTAMDEQSSFGFEEVA